MVKLDLLRPGSGFHRKTSPFPRFNTRGPGPAVNISSSARPDVLSSFLVFSFLVPASWLLALRELVQALFRDIVYLYVINNYPYLLARVLF